MNKWIKIEDESPEYYTTVKVRVKNGSIINAWRASDGENEMYTITGSDVILAYDTIIEWQIIERHEYIHFNEYNLRDDSVQAFLKSNELPLYKDMVKRGTDKMDRVFYFILWERTVIGYIITTTNYVPYEENGTLKYDGVHINQIELLTKYKGGGFGADAIKVLGLKVKSDIINKLTLVGKNDYLTLYYKSIGFTEATNGILYKII